MKIWFQCEQCLALHVDPDAANKCDHKLREEVVREAVAWAKMAGSIADPAALIERIIADVLPRKRT